MCEKLKGLRLFKVSEKFRNAQISQIYFVWVFRLIFVHFPILLELMAFVMEIMQCVPGEFGVCSLRCVAGAVIPSPDQEKNNNDDDGSSSGRV